MIAYVDASVVLRVVLGEEGQLSQWDQLEPVSSELVRVECLRTIERYRLLRALDDPDVAERRAAALGLLKAFDLASVSGAILDRAGDPFPTHVATLDAIHLSTALAFRDERSALAFATHDVKLATAARALGFDVHGA